MDRDDQGRPAWLVAGARAEAEAAAYLEGKGYRVLERGYRPKGVSGEIDLVVEKNGEKNGEREGVLVFVEVRYRQSTAFAEPFETVGAVKQRRVAVAALEYVTRYRLSNRAIRFDVVSVTDQLIEHFEDAFDAEVLGGNFAPYL